MARFGLLTDDDDMLGPHVRSSVVMDGIELAASSSYHAPAADRPPEQSDQRV